MTYNSYAKTITQQVLGDLMVDLTKLGHSRIKTEGTSLDELIQLCEGLRTTHKRQYHQLDPMPAYENALKITLHFLYGMRDSIQDSITIKNLETNPELKHFHEQARRVFDGNITDEDYEELGDDLKHIMGVK